MTKIHPDIDDTPPYNYLRTPYSIERDYTRTARRQTLTVSTVCIIAVVYFLLMAAPVIIPTIVALLAKIVISL